MNKVLGNLVRIISIFFSNVYNGVNLFFLNSIGIVYQSIEKLS